MKKRKPITRAQRAAARIARLRRDPGWRVSMEIGRYLKTVGWVAVVSGPMQVRGFEKPGLQRYEFVMEFTGGRLKPAPKRSEGRGSRGFSP